MSKRLLIIVALGLAVAGFYFGYQNNQEARRRAAAVVAADQAGVDTASQATALRAYVATHMGAGAEVSLTTSYDRARQAARAAAAAQAANSQIYADAQRVCGGKRDSVSQAKCQQDYLTKNLANVPLPTAVPEPKLADYQLKLRAPWWTPDLAGACFLGAGAALGFLGWTVWRRRRPV
jgi:hypothetical protein